MFLLIVSSLLSQMSLAASDCKSVAVHSEVICETALQEIKTEFEDKLDPNVRQMEELGWGRTESQKVKELQKRLGNQENYDALFLPVKFDLATLETFDIEVKDAGALEALRFFGEMLRRMNVEELENQQDDIMSLAQMLLSSKGLLGGVSATLIVGENRQFDWNIAYGKVQVSISDYKKPALGW